LDRTLDYLIITLYLIGVALFGIITGGRQKSTKDYFLGSQSVPWGTVCFSIVAAETSTLTFISIPGLAYLTNLNFLQVTFGYLIGRIAVAIFLLPAYYKGNIQTAYSYLETRYGVKTRTFSSLVFIFTRTAADGVRLFATAIPLKLLLGIDYPYAILIIVVVALIYTITGGLKGVIWVDVIQMFIYIGGAIITGIFLLTEFIPEGLGIFSTVQIVEKLSIINLGFENEIGSFFSDNYSLPAGLLGGAFLSMASHGTDQLIVQRLFATGDVRKAQLAVIGSGVIVIFQFALFLLIGVLLFGYYKTYDLSTLNLLKADEIFPKFIIESLPVGISGLIIAGLFAAAISTLAGSISSISSSTIMDLLNSKWKNISENLFISRIVTLFWAVILGLTALLFINSPTLVVELALSIASFTYGGLLGTFLSGIFIKNSQEKNVIPAFITGIIVMIVVIYSGKIGWTWYTIIGVAVTLSVAWLTSLWNKERVIKDGNN